MSPGRQTQVRLCVVLGPLDAHFLQDLASTLPSIWGLCFPVLSVSMNYHRSQASESDIEGIGAWPRDHKWF